MHRTAAQTPHASPHSTMTGNLGQRAKHARYVSVEFTAIVIDQVALLEVLGRQNVGTGQRNLKFAAPIAR